MTRPRLLAAYLVLVACTGPGSDIGPSIEPLPTASYQVLVRDAQDRGVTSAVVSVAGFTQSGVTLRSGRTDLPIAPSGFRNLTVAADYASATSTDLLAGLTIGAQMPADNQLPFVVFLPDLSASVGANVAAGVQPAAVQLDDSATSGAIVTIAAGSDVGLGTASSGTIRTGPLSDVQLPPAADPATLGGLLTGAGAFIGPADLTIAPGADLSLPNDLALPASSSVPLLLLDPSSGVWRQVATGTVDGSGTRIATGAGGVATGGLFAFGTFSGALSTVTGRVVDPDMEPLQGVLVRGPQSATTTDGSGGFTLSNLVAVDGQGQPRTVMLAFHGGALLRPVSQSRQQVLAAGSVIDLGTVTLDTGFVGLFRGLLINRGAIDPRIPAAVSTITDLSRGRGIYGDMARTDFAEIDADLVSWLVTRLDPRNSYQVLTTQGSSRLSPGQRSLDLSLFMAEVDWIIGGNGGTNTNVLDALGTGSIAGAGIVRLTTSGDQFFDTTTENSLFRVDYGSDGQAIASVETSSDGRTVVSAFTGVRPQTGSIELPLLRANRAPLGAFVLNGLVSGTLPGSGNTRLISVTPSIVLEQWFEDVFLGVPPVQAAVPRKSDPMVTGQPSFLVGVPAPIGNLVGVTGDTTAGVFTLGEFVFDADLQPIPGGEVQASLAGPFVADTDFQAPGALTDLDASLSAADFTFDLAVGLPSGTLLDVARGVGGNTTVAANGQDVAFRLPALTGQLQGATWAVSFGGCASAAGTTAEQRTLIELTSTTGPTVTLLPVPQILAPAPGASVPASGFQVQYSVPQAALYTVIVLTQDAGSVRREWTVVLPVDVTAFTFRQLPAPAVTPLATGVFRLVVSAARVQSGVLTQIDNPYQRVLARFLGLSAAERSVDAISSAAIDLTLQ